MSTGFIIIISEKKALDYGATWTCEKSQIKCSDLANVNCNLTDLVEKYLE